MTFSNGKVTGVRGSNLSLLIEVYLFVRSSAGIVKILEAKWKSCRRNSAKLQTEDFLL
jgi:hypothetical protein